MILAAELKLRHSTPEEIAARMAAFGEHRKATQPPGASMGSMFKNPAGDKAGRLIEAAGLKGRRVGNVEISSVHANFFVNHGRANAADVKTLIEITSANGEGQAGRRPGTGDRADRRGHGARRRHLRTTADSEHMVKDK